MPRRLPRATVLLGHLAEIAALLAAIGFLLGTFGRHHWVLDLASHFRFQYLAAFTFAALTLALACRWKLAVACTIGASYLASTLAPYYFPSPDKIAANGATELKLITYNVHTANQRHAEVTHYLLREDADVVILLEVSPAWIVDLAPLHSRYPYRYENPRLDNFGLALLSRYPFTDRSPDASDRFGRPVIDALVQLPDQMIKMIGVHPDPPISALASASRNEMLAALLSPPSDRPRPHPFIAAGDFNLSQFSPHFADLVRMSGLRDTAVGHGVSPTWMRTNPLFAVPIDQVLVSPDITVRSRSIGPALGSDHNPVVLQLALPIR